MTYAEKKLALGLKLTAIDTGFPVDFGFSKYEESNYLPGKVGDRRKLRAPAGDDLSHLNDRNFRTLQRVGTIGGKRRKK